MNNCVGSALTRLQELLGGLIELAFTAGAAKIVSVPFVIGMGARSRLDIHTADRIFH